MTRLEQNQQASVGDATGQAAVVDISWPQSEATGVYVFLLGAGGKFPSKHHLLFADRPTSPDGATRLHASGQGTALRVQVQMALSAVDPDVHRIRFVLAVSKGSILLSSAAQVDLEAWDPTTGDTSGTFSAQPGETNKCLVLADMYRDASSWVLEAKGDGFTGSISDLANQVGVAS